MPTVSFRFIGPMVVRSPNWLGDAIMALPAVRNLKTALWRDKLIVATPEKLAALWRACPFVDEVLPLPRPRNLLSTSRRISERKCASAVLLPNSLRSAAEVFLAKVPQRAGYASTGRRFFLTDTIVPPPFNPHRFHHSNFFLDLVAGLGGPSDPEFPQLVLPASNGSALLHATPPSPLDPVHEETPVIPLRPLTKVILCPGAEYGPAKRWPVSNFAEVGRHLHKKYGLSCLILGAFGDIPVANELEARLRTTLPATVVENRTGTTSLEEFMAELDRASVVVCNDSGAMHLASALRVPTVAVFGSTEPRWTGPLGTQATVIRHHVPCSPCFLRQCPLDLRCFHGISAEEVSQAVDRLLILHAATVGTP